MSLFEPSELCIIGLIQSKNRSSNLSRRSIVILSKCLRQSSLMYPLGIEVSDWAIQSLGLGFPSKTSKSLTVFSHHITHIFTLDIVIWGVLGRNVLEIGVQGINPGDSSAPKHNFDTPIRLGNSGLYMKRILGSPTRSKASVLEVPILLRLRLLGAQLG